MTAALAELDQALYVHEQWCNSIYCTLVCHLAPDERDLSDNPHRQCLFGQWYYGHQDKGLGLHPGFVAVAAEHEHLHRVAAQMLMTSQTGGLVQVREYEDFVSTITRMRAEILGLKHELEEGLTNLDPLTGATNRLSMLTTLRTQQELVKRKLQSCTISMMDLDSFKAVNDKYGHQVGDTALIETVGCVMAHLRPYDELFRYGGDEFLLLTPATDLETGYAAIERLREEIATTGIDDGDGQTLHVAVSFGITLLDPEVPVEESIARADRALYAAKAAGRNQTRIWYTSMT
jgi:diguanylate cyclase (GGDEF)-like protein